MNYSLALRDYCKSTRGGSVQRLAEEVATYLGRSQLLREVSAYVTMASLEEVLNHRLHCLLIASATTKRR